MFLIYSALYVNKYVLVNGKLIVIFEKNPSGGYRTNGKDKEGVIISVVPGGRANLPSEVTHKILFCLEWAFPDVGGSSVENAAEDGGHWATKRHTAIRKHDRHTSILPWKRLTSCKILSRL